MTWPYVSNKMATMLGETSALPSCTLCDDVSLCLGTIIGMNSVDFCIECFIMTSFGCRVMCTSRAVMCVSTKTRKKVTNHRGQSQNKQSGFERTYPTCKGYKAQRSGPASTLVGMVCRNNMQLQPPPPPLLS